MNVLSERLLEVYKPKMAIVVYESNLDKNNLYLERRPIKNMQMGAGVPLSKECVSKIMNTLVTDDKNFNFGISGAIPPNLLFIDTNIARPRLVWYRPPEKRMMYFSKPLGIEDGMMSVPGLVYMAHGESLSVYAFKGSKPKDKLFKAPFFNVDTTVCLGNARIAKPKNSVISDIMEYWENLFWRSEFAHILGANPVKGNLATITKNCIETGEKFPMDELVPSNVKLKDLLR